MKKILAILMVLMLVLANVAALAADEGGDETPAYSAAPGFSFEPIPKNYYKDSELKTAATVYPAETITFTIADADTGNPDGGANNVTVDSLTVAAVSGNKIKVTVPDLPEPGLYHFSITENEGKTQGVTYTGKDTELKISVLVVFDEDDTTKLVVDGYGVTATQSEDGKKEKVEEIANVYEVANLKITKTVSGNLGNKNKYFPVEVTFTPESGKTVLSEITITGETYTTKVEKIAAGWNAAKTVTIYVKNGDEITFQNIPLNVTYTVAETDATKHLSAKSDEPNNPDAYLVGGEVTSAATLTADATVDLTNEKDVEIDTGISMETVPYIMILALTLVGGVMLLIRKREEY